MFGCYADDFNFKKRDAGLIIQIQRLDYLFYANYNHYCWILRACMRIIGKQYCINWRRKLWERTFSKYDRTGLELTSSSLWSNRIVTIIATSLDQGLEYRNVGTLGSRMTASNLTSQWSGTKRKRIVIFNRPVEWIELNTTALIVRFRSMIAMILKTLQEFLWYFICPYSQSQTPSSPTFP